MRAKCDSETNESADKTIFVIEYQNHGRMVSSLNLQPLNKRESIYLLDEHCAWNCAPRLEGPSALVLHLQCLKFGCVLVNLTFIRNN